jgi:hypothetical protein
VSEPELTFEHAGHHLRLGELPIAEPSADLWPRIADAYRAGMRRARMRRLAVLCGTGVAVIGVLVGATTWRTRPAPVADVDWQARAQALELRLHTLETTQHRASLPADALSELARVDGALQAAYDDGAERMRLNALWKRRSELLSTLLQAREQNVEITRI